MRIRITLLMALLLAVLLVLLFAVPAVADSRDPNTRLERQIRHELIMLPYYGVFDDVSFKVDGANVTLLGQVTRPSLRMDAEQVVRSMEGVASIENRIEVLPLSSADDRIRRAVYNAIYRDDILYRYALLAVPSIHILVKNGHVTLEGTVGSIIDKSVARTRAYAVSNVFSVTDNLRLEP